MAKLKIERNVTIGGCKAQYLGCYAGIDYYQAEHTNRIQYIHGYVGDNHVFRINCFSKEKINFNFALEDGE